MSQFLELALEDPVEPEAIESMSRLVGKLPCTAVAIRALAAVVRGEFEDPEGADMIERLAKLFAIHEEKMF